MDHDYETWITEKGFRRGRVYARRHPLNVPLALATGRYEDLSELQLREFEKDIAAEKDRRAAVEARRHENRVAMRNWSPFAALRRAAA